MYYVILFAFLVGIPLNANLFMLDQQLSIMTSALSDSLPSTLKKCGRKIRFKQNIIGEGICFFNTAIDLLHAIYCSESFRKAMLSVSPPAKNADTVVRQKTQEILEDYDADISDIEFAQKYDAYVKTIKALNLIDLDTCGTSGGSTHQTLTTMINVLTGKTDDYTMIKTVQDLHDQTRTFGAITLSSEYTIKTDADKEKQQKELGTELEKYLFGFAYRFGDNLWQSPNITWPQFLIFTLSQKDRLHFQSYLTQNNWYEYNHFSFPETLDIAHCLPTTDSNKLKTPLNYRLYALATYTKGAKGSGHVASMLHHESQWYFCSDELIININEPIRSFPPTGYAIIGRSSPIKRLIINKDGSAAIQSANLYDYENSGNIYAIADVLIYQRVDS